MPELFTPVTIPAPTGPGLRLRNRLILAPMCQYAIAAHDGVPTDWQLVHLGSMAAGGFGLVLTEATAITAEGRISDRDTGIWNDQQRDAWARVVDFIHGQGAAAGIQLAHAGAKASTYGWLPEFVSTGRTGSLPDDEGGWQTVSPGSGAVFSSLNPPRVWTEDDIVASLDDWAAAARRADQAGFDLIQIHSAHGYLIHEFLSPLSNDRTDRWGGSFENRTRYLREVVRVVREAWPADKPLQVRFSGTDWTDEGWTLRETEQVAGALWQAGVTAFDLSSGGIGAFGTTPKPGYQVELATGVKQALAGLEQGGEPPYVTAVGLITAAEQANDIVEQGLADGVSIGRAALGNPQWAAQAAVALGVPVDQVARAPQYWRAG